MGTDVHIRGIDTLLSSPSSLLFSPLTLPATDEAKSAKYHELVRLFLDMDCKTI